MNTTFKCWLIANFEFLLFWIGFIICGLTCLIRLGLTESAFTHMLYYAIFSAMLMLPTKEGGVDWIRYLLMLASLILWSWVRLQLRGTVIDDDNAFADFVANSFFFWLLWTAFIVASVTGGFLAKYAYRNMDEVVSYRMLYRGSGVGLFQVTWKYTLSRFCAIAASIIAFVVEVASLIIIDKSLFIN